MASIVYQTANLSPNPSSNVIPVQSAGLFIDSNLYNLQNSKLIAQVSGVTAGFEFDFIGSRYAYGTAVNNVTIDNVAGEISLNGTAITSNSSSGASGRHLVLNINGTQYKIKLENP